MAKRRRSKKKSLKQQGQGCLFLIIIAVGIAIFFGGDGDDTSSNTSSSSVNRFRAVTAVSDSSSRASEDNDISSPSESTDEAESTPTRTRRPTSTRRPTVTDTPPPRQTTLYITSNANARECPELDCEIVTAYGTSDEVVGIAQEKGATVAGSDVWWLISRSAGDVYVHSSLLSTDTPAPVSNVNASTSNQNSNRTNNSTEPIATTAPIATAAPASVSRPGNCATAQAMGLTAQQAAQWSHLDRDGDGVACYGD